MRSCCQSDPVDTLKGFHTRFSGSISTMIRWVGGPRGVAFASETGDRDGSGLLGQLGCHRIPGCVWKRVCSGVCALRVSQWKVMERLGQADYYVRGFGLGDWAVSGSAVFAQLRCGGLTVGAFMDILLYSQSGTNLVHVSSRHYSHTDSTLPITDMFPKTSSRAFISPCPALTTLTYRHM